MAQRRRSVTQKLLLVFCLSVCLVIAATGTATAATPSINGKGQVDGTASTERDSAFLHFERSFADSINERSVLREDELLLVENFDELQRKWDAQLEIERQGDKLRLLAGPTPTLSPSSAAPTLPPNVILTPPQCINSPGEVAYSNGELSFDLTFSNCINNVGDALSMPTYMNGSIAGMMEVGTSIQLNNLHSLDAVTGKATIDFYLRLYWRDNRFNMPMFWNRVSPAIRKDGFYLTKLLELEDLKIWMPDFRFHDAANLQVMAQTLRLNSSNVFFWSRHIVAEFVQPTLEFADYPIDKQVIQIRFGSYSFNQNVLKPYFTAPAISYNQNYDGHYTFLANPMWKHLLSWSTYGFYTSSSGFKNVIYRIEVQRISSGILIRLVVPITILTILGGFTFWSHPESRFDSTITLLLAVSALYIVVMGNIPQLGYLTVIDRYCFLMFILLAVAALMHQGYLSLFGLDKVDIWDRKKILTALEDQQKGKEMSKSTPDDHENNPERIEGIALPSKIRDDKVFDIEAGLPPSDVGLWVPNNLVDLWPLRRIIVALLEAFGKIFILPMAVVSLVVTLQDGFQKELLFSIIAIFFVGVITIMYKESYAIYRAMKKCNDSLREKKRHVPTLLSIRENLFLQFVDRYFSPEFVQQDCSDGTLMKLQQLQSIPSIIPGHATRTSVYGEGWGSFYHLPGDELTNPYTRNRRRPSFTGSQPEFLSRDSTFQSGQGLKFFQVAY